MVTAEMVRELRNRTGARMMECKQALTEAGNLNAAVDWLRQRNLDTGSAMDKPATEGRLNVMYDDMNGRKVTMVEMTANTDFVAGNDEFKAVLQDATYAAHKHSLDTADKLLAKGVIVQERSVTEGPVNTLVGERVQELAGKLGENITIKKVAQFQGNVGYYLHLDYKQGAMVEIDGVSGELAEKIAKDICMHIVFAKPMHLNREEVPQALVEKEKLFVAEVVKADPKNSKKPAEIIEKIVEGRMGKFFAQTVITEQPYYKDGKKTLGQVLKDLGVTVKRFARFQVGVV